MKKNNYLCVLICTLFILSSCATLFSKKQEITVTSDVNGANVYKGKKLVGTTPCTFKTKVAKSKITVTKQGYPSQTIYADKQAHPSAILDIITIVPGWVDLLAGTIAKYGNTNYFVSLKDPSINRAYNEKYLADKRAAAQRTAQAMSVGMNILGNAMAAGAQAYNERAQEERAKKEAEEAQRKAQIDAAVAKSKANAQQYAAEREAREAAHRKQIIQNATPLNSDRSWSNGSVARNNATSDINTYNANRMSETVYGSQATQNALNQQRANDAAQRAQTARQQQNIPGTVHNAITASGSHVQIKVNGNSVTAYSLGNSMVGPEWRQVVSSAYVKETSNPTANIPQQIASQYAYTANVQGLGTIYWGTPTRRVIQDQPTGTPTTAMTANGQTIAIMVNGQYIVAYASGFNQASDINWKTIMPKANIMNTNNSVDGNLATRFKNKANISGLGVVYF